jgi:hypothetical protein
MEARYGPTGIRAPPPIARPRAWNSGPAPKSAESTSPWSACRWLRISGKVLDFPPELRTGSLKLCADLHVPWRRWNQEGRKLRSLECRPG